MVKCTKKSSSAGPSALHGGIWGHTTTQCTLMCVPFLLLPTQPNGNSACGISEGTPNFSSNSHTIVLSHLNRWHRVLVNLLKAGWILARTCIFPPYQSHYNFRYKCFSCSI
jgi:hypothetical protein